MTSNQLESSGLQELYSSGYLTELHAFSKMLHGVATLLPDALQVGHRSHEVLQQAYRLHLTHRMLPHLLHMFVCPVCTAAPCEAHVWASLVPAA